jgi:hypothetical protein
MDHPEIRLVSEDQAAKLSLQFAMEKLWNNPVLALQSAEKSLGDFFSVRDASAFGFVSGGDLTAFDHPLPEHELTYLITRLVLWGLSLAGVYPVWQTRRDALTRLQFWAVVGMIASVPFAPPRDAALMRVYAAAMPFLFMLPLMGLAYLYRRTPFALQTEPAQKISPRWGWGLGMALVILMSVGPLLLRWLQPVPGISTFSCPAEPVSAVIRVRQGSYLAVTADTEQERSRLPVIRQEDFLAALRQFPYGMAIRDLGTLAPPVWIMNAMDLRSGQMLWVVLPVDILPAAQEERYDVLLGICGDWMPGMQANGLGFLQVRSLYPLDAAPVP